MRASIALFIAIAAAGMLGCHRRGHHGRSAAPSAFGSASPDHVPPGINAVQNEMRLLAEAMRTSVSAIGYGELGAISSSVRAVHEARELTEKAVERGDYRLRKNPEKLATFKELDDEFHDELEKLVTAAESKDAATTGAQLGAVMSRCSGCHEEFRP